MATVPIALSELDLSPADRTVLETDAAVRETLARRLGDCGAAIRNLSLADLGRLVRGILRAILSDRGPADVPGWSCTMQTAPTAEASATDVEVDRRYGHILRRLPAAQQAAARERLRRGLAGG